MTAGAIKTQHLSRRLLANYLMFGLLSILALVTGLVLIVGLSNAPAGGQNLLSRLGTAAEQITTDYSAHRGDGVQSIIEDLGESPDLRFCSVISNDGIYLAHTNRQLVGRKAPRIFSAANAPGMIERVSYLREDNTGPCEYWLPLRSEQETYGMLQVGVQSNGSQHWIGAVSRHAGTAVMLPLILLVLGGLKLNKVVKSSSAIERQLAQLADRLPRFPSPTKTG